MEEPEMRPPLSRPDSRFRSLLQSLFIPLLLLLSLHGAVAQTPTHSVSGKITLQNVAAGNMAQPLTFSLIPTGSGSPLTYPLTPAADGTYTLTGVPAGIYKLLVKGSKWLQVATSVDVSTGDMNGANLLLLGGDANNDNQVTALDLLAVKNAYNTVQGDANYNAAADFNCDGQVTALDLLIVKLNYNEVGATPQSAVAPSLRVNAAGGLFTSVAGNAWAEDDASAPLATGGTVVTTTAAITGTDPGLYQTQREGTSFSYTLPAPNGSYTLNLLFAEIDGNTTGQRTFNVVADGQQILTDYDIYAASGGADTAVTKSFPVAVTNGQFTLTFTGVTGNAAVAAFSLLHSTPAADVLSPGWAEDMLPTDDGSEADGAGPSASMSVILPSGVEENTPGADLDAYNSVGPSVGYERMYRSTLAAQGYASPGLSAGWVDDYDLRVIPGSGSYTLTYPNGAVETWTGTTGSLGTPAGAPYLANCPMSGVLTMTFKDRSVYTFIQIGAASANYPAGTYLLTGIKNLVGHSVTLNRDTAANNYRLLSITNDAATPVTLLKFNYTSAVLFSVEDLASPNVGEHRQVNYSFTSGLLTGVSQTAPDGGSANDLWQYGYQTINGQPYLHSVSTPDPNDPSGMTYTSASVNYDASGFVQPHTDANARQRAYIPMGPGQTVVQVFNQAGVAPLQQWTQRFGASNVDTGFTDAASHSASVAYTGTPSPYLPSAVTNRNNQSATVTYDAASSYGNVATVMDARGIQVVTTYDYPDDFPLGQVASVQRTHVTNGTTDGTQIPTTYDYYTAADVSSDGVIGVLNGMVKAVHTAQPNLIGGSPTLTTTYAYDSLGNPVQMTTPGPYGTTTVSFNYTSGYNGYTQAEALGEPLTITVSGPDSSGVTTTIVSYAKYDGRGNNTAEIDALGNETDAQFNLADQTTSTISPATGDTGISQSHTDSAYAYVGGSLNSISVYDEGNTTGPVRRSVYSYGHEGELLFVSDLKGAVSSYVYDGRYRVSTLLDGKANPTYYDYDAVGNLADTRYPLAAGGFDTLTYGYDADQNLIRKIDGNGVEMDYQRYDPTTLALDPDDLVRTVHYVYPTGYSGTQIADVAYQYDSYARRIGMTDGTGSQSYTYDDLDDLLVKTTNFTGGPQGLQITRHYRPDGHLEYRDLPLPSGGSMGYDRNGYQYDGLGRLASFNLLPNSFTGFRYTYSYWANGWLKESDGPSSSDGSTVPITKTQYAYNPRGFLSTLENDYTGTGQSAILTPGILSKFTMHYDALGNRTTEAATIPSQPLYGGGSWPDASRALVYHYDSRDELTEETSTPLSSNAYNDTYDDLFDYDLAGNPTLFKGGSPSFNADNQNAANTHDGNGNPTLYLGASLLFDPENRLTSVPGTAGTLTATYNGDGLRAWSASPYRTTPPTGSNFGGTYNGTNYYLYDGDELVEEMGYYYGSLNAWTYGWGADGLRAYTRASGGYQVFTYDPQGSMAQLLEPHSISAGYEIHQTTLYDAYGQAHTQGGTAPGANIGFGGQFGYYGDPETGLSLLSNRYYDGGMGRFLTRDPIGYKGGLNLYGFADNNPVNESDPSGLAPTTGAPSAPTPPEIQQPTVDPLDETIERAFQKVGPGIIRIVIRPAGKVLLRVGGTAVLAGTLFFSADGGLVDDSTGPNSPYAIAQAKREKKPKLPKGGTYILRDPETGTVERTGMAANLTKRKSDHKKDYPNLTFEVDRRSGNRDARRGREQIIHEMYDPPLNKQNPISTKNNTPEEIERMMEAGRKL
jgi:RHS repeat-associated protein